MLGATPEFRRYDFTLSRCQIAATVGLIILILLVGALYQHYFIPLVVRSKPANE